MPAPAAEKSLVEDLADAFDAEEEKTKDEETEAEGSTAAETETDAKEIADEIDKQADDDEDSESDSDDEGNESDSDDDDAGGDTVDSGVGDPAAGGSGDGSDSEHDAETHAAADERKPPHTWTPASREKWGAIPSDVQDEITKRETEIATTLTLTAEQRQTAETFDRVVAPFKAVMDAEGAETPFHAIHNTLQVVAALRMGTADVKATTIASLIKIYGVNLETLADIIEGKHKPDAGGAPDVNAIVNTAVERALGKAPDQQQAALKSEVVSEIDTFAADPSNEFFNDVKVDMGTLSALAANKKEYPSLKELYTKAVSMRPDLVKIQAERPEKQQDKQLSKSDLRKKKAAAGSLKGKKSGDVVVTPGNSITDDISASIESLS